MSQTRRGKQRRGNQFPLANRIPLKALPGRGEGAGVCRGPTGGPEALGRDLASRRSLRSSSFCRCVPCLHISEKHGVCGTKQEPRASEETMGKRRTTITTKEVEGKMNCSSHRYLLNVRFTTITIQGNLASTQLLNINIGKHVSYET